jgi:hypothetical protein
MFATLFYGPAVYVLPRGAIVGIERNGKIAAVEVIEPYTIRTSDIVRKFVWENRNMLEFFHTSDETAVVTISSLVKV